MAPKKDWPKSPHISIEDALVRKRGPAWKLRREVEAMQYVRDHTTLPVPTVIECRLEDGHSYDNTWYSMHKLRGGELGAVWDNLNEETRRNTVSQLKVYLAQLHSLQPAAPSWIGSCSRGPVYDHRIDNQVCCGPFESVTQFHDHLIKPILDCPFPAQAAKYRKLLPDDDRICFVHADISWQNILVDPQTGDVTGILDWEMAGFWPEWWEYRKALYGSRSEPWWMDIVNEVLTPSAEATDADADIEMF